MDHLWTPWRYRYVTGAEREGQEDHRLGVPPALAQMPAAAAQEMMHLAQRVDGGLRTAYHPDGLNFGLNLGRAAGAGVAEHLHLHALPRWMGDTNFMTTTAETRVLPEPMDVTWQKMRDALAG